MRPLLESEVILAGKCTACGGCASVCPVNTFRMSENSSRLFRHCVECRRCDLVCPVLEGYDPGIGFYLQIYAGRSQFPGQDGGMTQAIVNRLFRDELVETIVAIGSDEKWYPTPKIITSFEEFTIQKFSRYTFSPLMPTVVEAISRGYQKIGVVGLGCQIHAAARARENIREIGRNISFLLGLVCMRTYRSKLFFNRLERLNISVPDIKKFTIQENVLTVEWGKDHHHSEPVKELAETTRRGCMACQDVTAMSADISLGGVGAPTGFNSVIIRSEYGMNLWQRLKPDIDVESITTEKMEKLNDLKLEEVKEYLGKKGKEPDIRTRI